MSANLNRRVRWIVAATISYNIIEAIVALVAGGLASSAALIGFGLDSIIEVTSALAVAWQFSHPQPKSREKLTMRIISIAFLALAAYVTFDAVSSLLTQNAAQPSPLGIGIATASVIMMPALAWVQYRTGRALGSASVMADSKQLLLCVYLSAAVLVGLVLNAAWGWYWADSVAALVIAALALREGINAWRAEEVEACCGGGAIACATDNEK